MKTPVIFIIFNRPEKTKRVFEMIRKAKPQRLLVIADGARAEHHGEEEICTETRAIVDRIDWSCEVLKNYSEVNLGCLKRISTGLDWAFDIVGEGIILEDDCLPHSSFFDFCELLLDRYRYDSRIMSISGQNVQLRNNYPPNSYYFSRYNHCWGWASWKRAWDLYDVDMKIWPEAQVHNILKDILVDERAVRYWSTIFQNAYEKKYNTWDYQWTFSCWIQNGLSIIPNVNLVSNIGFGENSTNTKVSAIDNPYAELPTKAVSFPLKHLNYVARNARADLITQNEFYDPSFFVRLNRKVKRILLQSKI